MASAIALTGLTACGGGGGGGGGTSVGPLTASHVFTLTNAATGQPITSSASQPAAASSIGTVIVTETNYSGSFTISPQGASADGCVGVGQDAPPNANYFNFASGNSRTCQGNVEKFTFSDTLGNSIDLYMRV